MPAPLLHIGFQKTASTWLQDKVFESAAVGFGTFGGEAAVKREIIAPDDLEFDAAACREAFAGELEAVQASGLVPVLSAERLSGDMLYGAYDGARLADRLVGTFPEARVLIVVREQRSMLFSTYQQYVKVGGLLELRDYLRRASKSHPWPCDLRRYEYDRLIGRYHELFQAERVLALPYELFQSDPIGFVHRIAEFGGAAPDEGAVEGLKFGKVMNRSLPASTIAAKRRLNWLVRERMNPWAPIEGKGRAGRRLTKMARSFGRSAPDRLTARIELRMRETIAETVGDRYRASNARTSAMIGLDLAEFGYDAKPATRDANAATASSEPVGTRS
jgi:sulfotransferase family protein